MANPEHLRILEQGVDVWNRWREENRSIRPDLSNINLSNTSLYGASLSVTNLSGTNLTKADLTGAHLTATNCTGANLTEANLTYADLFNTKLFRANLTKSMILSATLYSINLSETNFRLCTFSFTSVVDTDLRGAKHLEEVNHGAPSFIDIATIFKSKGNIPESFLRGCGVPENFIQYMSSLTGKAFDFYSCFISYSSKDQGFAERLHADLQNKGVRCWFAPEDMKIGDKIRDRIDQSIRLHDKLLLVLSESSINSEWVEDEVESAYEQEKKRNKTVLFPIRLDDAVMDTDKAWAAKLRRSRNIGDFTRWKDHDSYQKALDRLLRDLKAEKE